MTDKVIEGSPLCDDVRKYDDEFLLVLDIQQVVATSMPPDNLPLKMSPPMVREWAR